MINSNICNNGTRSSETSLPAYHNKQPPITIKKIALRDAPNDNNRVTRNHTTSPCSLGVSSLDKSKVSPLVGTKRPSPGCSPNSYGHQSIDNGVPDYLIIGGRKIDKETGKRQRAHGHNTSFAPLFAPIPMTSLMTVSPCRPSIPISLEKPDNHIQPTESNHRRDNSRSKVFDFVVSKGNDDQQRKERLLRLQKLLQHCEESDQKDYVRMLRCLSPLELSRHAVELEKRSIQLSVEEGKEIQRMKALNILGNLQ